MSKIINKTIGELFFSYTNGFSFKSEDFLIEKKIDTLPVLKIANIGNFNYTDFSDCHYHEFIGYENYIVEKGDLAFSLTGSLGYVSVITEKCLVNQRVFVIKRIPEYSELLDIIQPIIKSSTFTNYCYSFATSESNKNISPKIILNYKIPIYVKEDSSYDLEREKELAEKYKDIEEKKKVLLDKIESLRKYKILIEAEDNISYKNIDLNDMITHNNGNSSYTKAFCQKNKGNIPLYSANNSKPIDYMNKVDYNGEYLSYSKNGCAGYISIINGEFSVNGDRCVITLNKGYEEINLLYLKYFLEPIFRANIKGRIGVNGKNEYTKLNSSMIKKLKIQVPIPINHDGTFDLKKQKELATKYAMIEDIKQNIYNQIKELTSIIIN